MATVTQATVQTKPGSEVNNLLKTTLQGQGGPGPTQESCSRVPGTACKEPCPFETPGP